MPKKDRYLLLELCLTFFLLFLVIHLFGKILSAYRVYLIFGLLSGFCFSWFTRNRYSQAIRLFIALGASGTLLSLIYSILNSSLFYKDVILICIKRVLILEFILGFSACLPPFLSYIQALSIPLFMSYPIFIKDSSNATPIIVILTLAYFMVWFAIFKVKLYEFFHPSSEKIRRYYSIFVAGVFFLIILISSWMFFSKFPLGQFRKGGLFSAEGPGEETGIEKEYYYLQDETQEKITKLIPEFNTEERYEILALLSYLIKEPPYIIEVDKAELGLVNHLKQPGPGLDKKETEELTVLIKNYVDKKTALNLKRTKSNIIDILRKRPLDIKNRVSILNRVNKVQYSNSYQKVREYEKELEKNINNSSLPANVKRELKEVLRQLKEWKTFELYRKEMTSLDKSAGSLKEELKKELADLPLEIKRMGELSDFKQADAKLGKLKDTASPESKDFIKEIEKISDLKLELSLAEKTRNLKEKLEASHLSEDKITELKEDADNIKNAENHQNLSKYAEAFKEKIEEEKIDVYKELEELLKTKTYSLLKQTKGKVEDALKESILSDVQRKDFLKDLEKLESDRDSEKLTSDIKKLEAVIDKFLNQGFISQKSRDNLIKETGELNDLLLSQLQAKYRELTKQKEQADSQKQWEEQVDKLPLKPETKQALKQLAEELSQADTLSQLEEARQQTEQQLNALSKQGIDKKIEELKEAFEPVVQMQRMYTIDKSLYNLRKNIEELKKMDPQAGRILDDRLRKVRDSSTEEEFKKRLDNLEEYIVSKKFKTEEERREPGELGFWQIYIMPSRLVVPMTSTAPLKAIAVYNNIFVKELSSELEWFSSEPNVARVDGRGTVSSLSKGKATISAKYKGKTIEGAEILVVDKIPEEIDSEIKSQLMR